MDRQKVIEAAVEEAMKLLNSGEFDQFDPRQALSALVALRVPDATVGEMQNAIEECAEVVNIAAGIVNYAVSHIFQISFR